MGWTRGPLDHHLMRACFCRAFSTPKLLRKGPRRKPCGQRPFHRRISQVQDCKTIHNGPLADANHVSREYRAPASEPDCVWQAEHADSKPFHDGLMSKARRIVKEDESIQCKLKLLPHAMFLDPALRVWHVRALPSACIQRRGTSWEAGRVLCVKRGLENTSCLRSAAL